MTRIASPHVIVIAMVSTMYLPIVIGFAMLKFKNLLCAYAETLFR